MNSEIPLKVYFHTQENYYPSSFQYFVENSKLYDKGGNDLGKKTQSELLDLSCPTGRDDFVLKVNSKEIYNGMKDNIDAIPFYKYERVYDGKKYIIYSLFYPYSGEYNILGLENAGEHGGDAEHMTFELDERGKVSRIYFGAHGDSDGRWLNEKDVSKEDGQYVAYVAYHGHGFYPEQGTYFRNYGLSNDYTNKGKIMSTLKNPVINIPSKDTLTPEQKNNVGLAYYCGMIGENGIDSYYRKGWFNNIDKEENPPKLINNTLFVSVRAVIFVFIVSLILYLFLLGRKLNKFNTFAPYVYYMLFVGLFIFGIYKLKQLIRSFS